MSVEFVDELPAAKRPHIDVLQSFAEVLRENPGQWAKHPTNYKDAAQARTSACNIRKGRSKIFRPGEFEAEARDGVVYVRFVGGEA